MRSSTLLLWTCVLVVAQFVAVSSDKCRDQAMEGSERDSFHQLTDPCRYDRLARPNQTEKTIVYVHMHIYSIGSFDSQNLHYSTKLVIRFRWNDPRLKHGGYIERGDDLVNNIWIPHIYIVNEHESKVMGSSRKDIMNMVRPDGTVILCSRMQVTLQCIMDFQKFPFDTQYCPLIMESWRYNTSQLELRWEEEDAVTIDSNLQLSEYSLVNVLLNETSKFYGRAETSSPSYENFDAYYAKAGNFSTLTLRFELRRQFGFYIMDYYVPSVMIVILSWVTFWLDASSTPARTAIGTSTLLTLITLSRNLDSSLPKVSYIKASEIWFLGCTAFIFFSVTEFAFVNIIWRRKRNVTLKKATGKHILQSTLTPQMYREQVNKSPSKSLTSLSSVMDSTNSSVHRGCAGHLTLSIDFRSQTSCLQKDLTTIPIPAVDAPEEERSKSLSLLTMTPQEIANWIDRRSRVVFPLAFLTFNIFYWVWTLMF